MPRKPAAKPAVPKPKMKPAKARASSGPPKKSKTKTMDEGTGAGAFVQMLGHNRQMVAAIGKLMKGRSW